MVGGEKGEEERKKRKKKKEKKGNKIRYVFVLELFVLDL